jgi:hypothetical protein
VTQLAGRLPIRRVAAQQIETGRQGTSQQRLVHIEAIEVLEPRLAKERDEQVGEQRARLTVVETRPALAVPSRNDLGRKSALHGQRDAER